VKRYFLMGTMSPVRLGGVCGVNLQLPDAAGAAGAEDTGDAAGVATGALGAGGAAGVSLVDVDAPPLKSVAYQPEPFS
jgi:hypothetical protein